MSADPHAFRGAHPTDGGVVIRTVRPAAKTVAVFVDDKQVGEHKPADTDGLFEGVIKGAELPLDYQLEVDYGENGGTFRIEDPYRFTPTIGEGLTDARTLGLGGWTLDVHQVYDPIARVLHGGGGRQHR